MFSKNAIYCILPDDNGRSSVTGIKGRTTKSGVDNTGAMSDDKSVIIQLGRECFQFYARSLGKPLNTNVKKRNLFIYLLLL